MPTAAFHLSCRNWNRDGDVLARLQGHGADVTAVHFHPLQPHLLASCSEDGVIKVG